MNQDDNTQLILQLETSARLLGGALGTDCHNRHYDLIMRAAKRIRELDTEICLGHRLESLESDISALSRRVDRLLSGMRIVLGVKDDVITF